MGKIHDYYDNIRLSRSPEELARAVLSAAEKPKRRGNLRLLWATVAAAAALTAGVSAAAATGLIDLNTIFGGRIVAENEQLAGDLMAAAEGLEWTVSDDDYMIEFKGLTGSESDMLLLYTVVRRDGRPVTDFMTNIPEDGVLYGLADADFRAADEEDGSRSLRNSGYRESMGDSRYTINADGNIEVYKWVCTDGSIAGQYYSEEIMCVYPKKQLTRFKDENKLTLWGEWGDTPAGFYTRGDNERAQPVLPVNDERIIGLELEWSVGFTYCPSRLGLQNKTLAEDNAEITLQCGGAYGALATVEFVATESQFSSVGGRIQLVHYGTELKGSSMEKYNDVFLIMNDGAQVVCTVNASGAAYSSKEQRSRVFATVQYSDTEYGNITAVDINEVSAISINGTVYTLK